MEKPSIVVSEFDALRRQPRNILKLLVALAVVGTGALVWNYLSTIAQEKAKQAAGETSYATTPATSNTAPIGVSQKSSGDNSPNVANVSGNVNIGTGARQ